MSDIDNHLTPAVIAYWSGVLGTKKRTVIARQIFGEISPFLSLSESQFLGSGSESLVFLDNGMVKKFLLAWPEVRAPFKMTAKILEEVSRRIPAKSKHFYSFRSTIISDQIILVEYPYEDSDEITREDLAANWYSKWRESVLNLLEEARTYRVILLNPKAKNFRVAKNILKLIDYGRDITTSEFGQVELDRMFFMMVNDIYHLGPTKDDFSARV